MYECYYCGRWCHKDNNPPVEGPNNSLVCVNCQAEEDAA